MSRARDRTTVHVVADDLDQAVEDLAPRLVRTSAGPAGPSTKAQRSRLERKRSRPRRPVLTVGAPNDRHTSAMTSPSGACSG